MKSPPASRSRSKSLPAYKDPKLPASKRVADLLARMTLEEKAAQMVCVWQKKTHMLVDSRGNFDLQPAKAAFKKCHGLGQVGRPSDAGAPSAEPWKGLTARGMAELTNAIQKFFLEHSRLGIPVMFLEESQHGQAARDPRWGRVEETYGEDPFLNTQLGMAAVRGFQGDCSFKDKRHVIATLKHFAAHGQPESGIQRINRNMPSSVAMTGASSTEDPLSKKI